MYEEEDDDMPAQYRRLTAHLQTGSADFNRRLAAYLTNHVAMRSALEQTINHSYAQQFPNAPQAPQSMFQSPLLPEHMRQNGSIYRQPGFAMPNSPAPGSSSHARSSSIATPQGVPATAQVTSPLSPDPNHPRRMSVPANAATPGSEAPLQGGSLDLSSSAVPQVGNHNAQFPMPNRPQPFGQSALDMQGFDHGSPFSMALPPETQMLLGNTLDPNDFLTPMLMSGSEFLPQHGFNADHSTPKPTDFQASYGGMNSTVAPSALDIEPNAELQKTVGDGRRSHGFSTFGDFGLGSSFKRPAIPTDDSTHDSVASTGSGIGEDWGNFINDTSYENNPT
ncbi:MAG: hypothetical protein M1825_005065 [Sarcosagium campestre]|nr:MAG: hypothetical protein M1825_005065 [Sarcosagium campestre]